MGIKLKASKCGELIVRNYWIVAIGFIISIIVFINANANSYILDEAYEYNYFVSEVSNGENVYYRSYGLEGYSIDDNSEQIAFEIYGETNYLNTFEKSQEYLNKIGYGIKYDKPLNSYNYLQEEQLKEIDFLVYNKETNKYLTNSESVAKIIESKNPNIIDKKFVVNNFVAKEEHFCERSLRDFQFDKTYNYLYYEDGSQKEEKEGRHSDYVKNPKDYKMYFWIPKKSFEPNGYYGKYLREKEKLESIVLKEKLIFISTFSIMLLFFILSIYALMKKNIIKRIKNYIFDFRSLPSKVIIVLLFLICSTIYILSSSINESNYYFSLSYLKFYNLKSIVISYGYIILVVLCIAYFIWLFVRIQEIIDLTSNIDKPIKRRKLDEKNLEKLIDNFENLKKVNDEVINEKIKSERLKAELVTNISHDLKTPLTSIINYTDILLNKEISEEKRKDYLKILNNKSLKLKFLIEDLFEISKITSGKEKANLSKVDLVEIINQSLGELSSDIHKNKIEINFTTSNKEVIMNLDGNKMSRVFENIISNITKYSLKGTRAYINVESLEKNVVITFKNISKDRLNINGEEIFNRFTRGDTSRNSKIEGNGLGLSIAKSIIELHNGKINVIVDGDLFKVETILEK